MLLRAIGREGEITSKARESAHSLGRLLTFLVHAANEREEVKPLQARILRTAARDVASLSDHATFLSGKIIFLLDATLGMSDRAERLIKIFSVAAVIFLPPTLIAPSTA